MLVNKRNFWSGGNRTSDEGVDGCRREEQRFDPVGYTVGRLDVGLVHLGEVSDGAALDDDAHGIGFPPDDDVSALNGLDHRVVDCPKDEERSALGSAVLPLRHEA